MIHSVALVIADFFVSKDVITEEEKEVCAYGMELIISGIINVSLVIINYYRIDNMQYMVCHCIQHNDDCHKNVYGWISCGYASGM